MRIIADAHVCYGVRLYHSESFDYLENLTALADFAKAPRVTASSPYERALARGVAGDPAELFAALRAQQREREALGLYHASDDEGDGEDDEEMDGDDDDFMHEQDELDRVSYDLDFYGGLRSLSPTEERLELEVALRGCFPDLDARFDDAVQLSMVVSMACAHMNNSFDVLLVLKSSTVALMAYGGEAIEQATIVPELSNPALTRYALGKVQVMLGLEAENAEPEFHVVTALRSF